MASVWRTDGVRSTRQRDRGSGARQARERTFDTPLASQAPGDRRRVRRGMLAGIVLVGALCCSCGGPGVARSAPSGRRSAAGSPTSRATRPARGDAGSTVERRNVLRAWVAAERTVYRYNDEPAAPLRADIQAGEASASLFPDLGTYFTGAALATVTSFLVALKMNMLRGPVSFNLGHPKVVALTATTATVESCVFDTGTTTESGAPGPPALDGGGAGSYSGRWNLTNSEGSWKVATFETHVGPKC